MILLCKITVMLKWNYKRNWWVIWWLSQIILNYLWITLNREDKTLNLKRLRWSKTLESLKSNKPMLVRSNCVMMLIWEWTPLETITSTTIVKKSLLAKPKTFLKEILWNCYLNVWKKPSIVSSVVIMKLELSKWLERKNVTKSAPMPLRISFPLKSLSKWTWKKSLKAMPSHLLKVLDSSKILNTKWS